MAISGTGMAAKMAAAGRAPESRRPHRLFDDPHAQALAGEDGFRWSRSQLLRATFACSVVHLLVRDAPGERSPVLSRDASPLRGWGGRDKPCAYQLARRGQVDGFDPAVVLAGGAPDYPLVREPADEKGHVRPIAVQALGELTAGPSS